MSKSKKKINHCAVFKQRTKNDDNAELSNSMIICARKTGQLSLSSRGLFTGIYIKTRLIDLANIDNLFDRHRLCDYTIEIAVTGMFKTIRYRFGNVLLCHSCMCVSIKSSGIMIILNLMEKKLNALRRFFSIICAVFHKFLSLFYIYTI